jgi:transposase
MSASRRRFSQEFKDELCCEGISTSKTAKAVATEYGIGAETLRNWLKKYLQEYAADEQAGHLSLDGRAAVGAAGVHQARRPPVPSGLTRLSRGSDGGVCMQWLNVRPGMTVEWESTYQHWPGNRTNH